MDGMTEWNKACLPCRLVHATCNGERPCKRCSALGRPDNCVNVERKKRGRPRKNPIEGEELLEKRARLNEGSEPNGATSSMMADGSGAHNMATTYHMSFPSLPVQQQPQPHRGSYYPSSSSPSDSLHSSPSSSSSSSSLDELQQSEPSMLARPQRHHHHHNQHHHHHSSGGSGGHQHRHHKRSSRDRHEEERSTDVGLLVNEMRELRKENKMLNEKLATFCEKVDRRLTSSECKIDSLSQALTTTTSQSTGAFNMSGSTPAGWSSTATFSASPLFIRKEVLKDLPFLLDYDIISEQVPFLIDDLRKPFIVRRIFDPTPEEDLTVPVTTYANPACCALLGTVLHELVGAPCWFALEQPIRAYLTARSDKPVGDIFLNAVTRKGNHKRLLRLFSRNQVFYNAKGNAKWWISIIDKTEELTASGQQDSNKIALILNRNRRGGATISLLPKDGESDDEDATPTTAQTTSPSSSGSSPAVSTPSTSSSSAPSSSYTLTSSSSSAPSTSAITTISSLPASSSALSTSRSLAPASSFATAANFFVPAATYASPFISTSALAPVSSPSFSSFLYGAGLPGAISAPALRSEAGAVGELSDFASSIAGGGMNPRMSQGGGDKPTEYLDPELQELWALLAPTDFSGNQPSALSTCK